MKKFFSDLFTPHRTSSKTKASDSRRSSSEEQSSIEEKNIDHQDDNGNVNRRSSSAEKQSQNFLERFSKLTIGSPKPAPWVPTEPSLLEAIPRELHVEILMYLTPAELGIVSRLSSYWNDLANNDFVWRRLCMKSLSEREASIKEMQNEIEAMKDLIASNLNKPIDKITMKQVFREIIAGNPWDPKFGKKDIRITENGRVAEHTGSSCTYRAIRAKFGYSRGRHYWECKIRDASTSGYNIYIGVAFDDFRQEYRLGGKDSWGLRGLNGCIYHDGKRQDYTSMLFTIGMVVGVLLDMDEMTICWFLNGQECKTLRLMGVGNRKLYPAVSFINPKEIVSIDFQVPWPKYKCIEIENCEPKLSDDW